MPEGVSSSIPYASKRREGIAFPGSDIPSPRFFVLVGIPGCGKTTYARKVLAHAMRISLDDLRLMFTGASFELSAEPIVARASDALCDAVAELAGRKRSFDVLYDATNVTRVRRSPLIATARQNGLNPIAVLIRCSLAVAQQRNQSRLAPVPPEIVDAFFRRLEPPTIEEGFAGVFVVDNTDSPA